MARGDEDARGDRREDLLVMDVDQVGDLRRENLSMCYASVISGTQTEKWLKMDLWIKIERTKLKELFHEFHDLTFEDQMCSNLIAQNSDFIQNHLTLAKSPNQVVQKFNLLHFWALGKFQIIE